MVLNRTEKKPGTKRNSGGGGGGAGRLYKIGAVRRKYFSQIRWR